MHRALMSHGLSATIETLQRDTFHLRSVSAHQAEYLSLKQLSVAIDCCADDPRGLQQQFEAVLDDVSEKERSGPDFSGCSDRGWTVT